MPTRERRTKLGELLAARGKLDRAVLLDALRQQRQEGGRLGTCLLELGAVDEADLLDVLSGQLKLPFVDADALRSIPDETLRLVPRKVAVRRSSVPVRSSGTQLSVAMLNPNDLEALDELSFVSGRRIRPHVALEIRIQEALGKGYGHDIPTRFVQLIDRLNRARFLWKDEEQATASEEHPGGQQSPSAPVPASPYPELPPPSASPAPSPYDQPAPPEPVVAPLPTAATQATPAAPAFLSPPAAPSPGSPRAAVPPPPTAPAPATAVESAAVPLAFAEAVVRLGEPRERDEVGETLTEYLRTRVDVGVLLMLRRGQAIGWRACGLEGGALEAIRVSLREPSVVHALNDGAPLHRGPLTALKGNAPLHAAIGSAVADLVAFPIRVRERLVAVLLAVSRDAALAADLVEELHELANRASSALEALVLRRKRGGD